jgi:hypothetical protein
MAYIDLDSPRGPLVGGTAGPANPYPPVRQPTRTPTPRPGGFEPSDSPFPFPNVPAPTPTPAPTTPPGGGGPTVPNPNPNPNPAPPTTPPKFSLGAFRDAFNRITAGRNGTVEDFITNVFPALQREFPDIKRFGSKGEKIQLPDGTVIDAVIAAGVGGRGYSFQIVNGPGSFFGDPIGNWFETMIGGIIDQLGVPREVPGQVHEAYEILKRFATMGGGAPDFSELQANTKKRIAELNAEPFSASEEAAQRVRAFDNLERSRAVAIQQVRERLVAQGHAPSSGTVEAAIQQVNQSFDSLRAQNENGLLLNNINERQRRKSEAITIEQQLADRLLGGASIDMQGRGQSINAAQTLAAMAQYIGNFLDPTSRIGMLLQAIGLIPQYAQQQWDNANDSANSD